MRGARYGVLVIAIAALISACSGAGVSGTAGSSGYPGGVYDQEVTLTAGTVGDGLILLEWEDPADPNFDHVMVSCDGSLTVPKGTQGVSLEQLENGTEYTVVIKAVEAAGAESEGQSVHLTPTAATSNVTCDFLYTVDALRGFGDGLADHYVLMANLDLSGVQWEPISNYSSTRIFDGNGHVIRNLTLNKPTATAPVGLFGYSAGTIRNLALENASITGAYATGALVGINNGTIDSCRVTGTVAGMGFVGGLAGGSYGSIEGCYSHVTVVADETSGGLVGYNTGVVSRSYATGLVHSGT